MTTDLEMAAREADSASTAPGAPPSANFAGIENINPTLLPGPVPRNSAERKGLRHQWQWVLGLLGSRSKDVKDARGTDAMEESSKIEFLQQYNVLWARAKLLRHYNEPKDLVDDEVADRLQSDLQRYCKAAVDTHFNGSGCPSRCADSHLANALRDYRFFTTEGQFFFPTSDHRMNSLAKDISQLEDMRSQLKRLPQESDEAKDLNKAVGEAGDKIGQAIRHTISRTTSDITQAQARKNRQTYVGRAWAALCAGAALLTPMIIMSRFRGEFTALITTYIFVVVVAYSLAKYMTESQPKDIFACTAAYAAVLVVFVGVSPPPVGGT